MRGDGGFDFIALGGNRQRIVVTHRWHTEPARLNLGTGRLETLQPLRQLGFVHRRLLAQLMQLAAQAMTVAQQGLVEVFQQLVNGGRGVGHRVIAGWGQGDEQEGGDCRIFA